MLPFGYALRNLARRRIRALLTIVGIALVTLLVVVMTAFASGLERAGEASARSDVVILLGASAEMDMVRSVIPRGSAEVAAASVPGVRIDGGVRAASVELHIATRSGGRIGLLRGVTPAAYAVHPQVTVVEGHEPRQPDEIMVGALAATRMGLDPTALAVGSTLRLEGKDWRIAGRFAAPGTVMEAEIWGRLDDIMTATRRQDVSCVAVRLENPAALSKVRLFAARRLDLEIAAVPATEFYAALGRTLAPIVGLARWMAVLVLVGGAFACANTMFAAVLARTKELATLRALGYAPAAVALSLVQEAMLVAFFGAAGGLGIAMLIGEISLRFPMGAFTLELDMWRRGIGLAAALAAGMLGAVVPAIRVVKAPLVDALGGRI